MENVARALVMAGSMLLFVIGFSYAMYLINQSTSTITALTDKITTTNFYDNIEIADDTDLDERIVGVDTIVSTLYRYYKESYSVRILDSSGDLIQLFDNKIEGEITAANSYTGSSNEKLLALKESIYNQEDNPAYMFGAPWTADPNTYAITRVDYFLNGTKGYINNVLVDYSEDGSAFSASGGFLAEYDGDAKFVESMTQYAYSGETISVDKGGNPGLETITGNSQEKTKIIITYKEL